MNTTGRDLNLRLENLTWSTGAVGINQNRAEAGPQQIFLIREVYFGFPFGKCRSMVRLQMHAKPKTSLKKKFPRVKTSLESPAGRGGE